MAYCPVSAAPAKVDFPEWWNSLFTPEALAKVAIDSALEEACGPPPSFDWSHDA